MTVIRLDPSSSIRSERKAPMLSASNSTAAADGWKRVKPRSIQRVAPLTFSPSGSTATTMRTASAYRSHWKRR